MNTTTLTIKVDYDPEVTDPESLAQCADNLLEMALSTPGIVEEYGEPSFDAFLVENDGVPIVDELTNTVKEATALFDALSGASYFGFGFRQSLIIDEEAREAARVLVSRLKHHGAKGLDG